MGPGFIAGKSLSTTKFMYAGSAIGLDGVVGRVMKEHMRPAHRQDCLQKRRTCFLYTLLEDTAKPREALPRRASIYVMDSGDEVAQVERYISVHLHETMLQSFPRTYRINKNGKISALHRTNLSLGPWTSPNDVFEWQGTNGKLPINEQWDRPTGPVEIDREARVRAINGIHSQYNKDTYSGTLAEVQALKGPPKNTYSDEHKAGRKVSQAKHAEGRSVEGKMEHDAYQRWYASNVKNFRKRLIREGKGAQEIKDLSEAVLAQGNVEKPWMNDLRPPKTAVSANTVSVATKRKLGDDVIDADVEVHMEAPTIKRKRQSK